MTDFAMQMREQGVWADGSTIFTCGATTGYSVKPIAFCDSTETAKMLAEALTERTKATDVVS